MKRKPYNYVEPHPWRNEPEHRLNHHAAVGEDCQFSVYGRFQCSRRYVHVVERGNEAFRACGWHTFLSEIYGWNVTAHRRSPGRLARGEA